MLNGFRIRTITTISAVCCLTIGAIAFSADAEAALCGERDEIRKLLTDRYQESSRGVGLVSDKGVVELLISETGTWSILMTSSTGSTCIVAAGHTWQELAAEIKGPAA